MTAMLDKNKGTKSSTAYSSLFTPAPAEAVTLDDVMKVDRALGDKESYLLKISTAEQNIQKAAEVRKSRNLLRTAAGITSLPELSAVSSQTEAASSQTELSSYKAKI